MLFYHNRLKLMYWLPSVSKYPQWLLLAFCNILPFILHCVRKKSQPNTMYHRNVKSECILCKFCMLYSKVFCEICTKFHWKILTDCRVINL